MREVLNVTDLGSSKVFQERPGIKSLLLHFEIGNAISELDLRGPFSVRREKETPVKHDSPA